MSNSTAPGWYPDPQRAPAAGAPQERYWDGGGWTAQTRPAVPPVPPAVPLSDASPAYGHPAVPAPAEPSAYGFPPPPYGYPQAPGYPPPGPPPAPPAYLVAPPAPPYGAAPYFAPPAPARNRTGLVVGVLAGALVLIGATVAGAAALLGSAGAAVHPGPVAAQPAPQQPTPTPSDQPPLLGKAPVSPDGTTVKDLLDGWTVPLPSGWTSEDHDAGSALWLTTTPYDCSAPGGCVRGNFSIDSGPTQGPDAQTAARAAMPSRATQLYGALVSHQELVSGPITVAGLAGYAVRWHVAPTTGAQGYLLVVALPATGGGFTVLVGSVDDDPSAPKPAVLEQLVAGITTGPPPNAA
ncbi:hypothetical protein P3T36_005821 [Kitasatospora sp. MAP12-15]|uniref:DUF2510 domain-containing protein n=1 Tax=unclassified Kitasatospora TaxID=2633591 RepID=UPI0024747CE0|nr:DUF2510 domain-containing protein [Kitasatospora sp. MAP12-44]MDH6110095.1 hypothetical protein [Kitasatospora sp. MAP12-44]